MEPMQIDGKSIPRDRDGYLRNLADWNPAVANALAAEYGIVLEPEHLAVIGALRTFYAEHRISPATRVLVKVVGRELGAHLHGFAARKAQAGTRLGARHRHAPLADPALDARPGILRQGAGQGLVQPLAAGGLGDGQLMQLELHGHRCGRRLTASIRYTVVFAR